MTIQLPRDLESSVQAAVRSGQFASVDDAMVAAVRLLLGELNGKRVFNPSDSASNVDPVLGLHERRRRAHGPNRRRCVPATG